MHLIIFRQNSFFLSVLAKYPPDKSPKLTFFISFGESSSTLASCAFIQRFTSSLVTYSPALSCLSASSSVALISSFVRGSGYVGFAFISLNIVVWLWTRIAPRRKSNAKFWMLEMFLGKKLKNNFVLAPSAKNHYLCAVKTGIYGITNQYSGLLVQKQDWIRPDWV